MKKKLAVAALTIVTCTSFGIFAACGNDEGNTDYNADISLMNYWKGNEDEVVYEVTNETNGDLTIEYTKTSEWQYAKRTFVEDSEHLGNMKTLVLECSIETTNEYPRMTLSILYKGDIAKKEVHFEMGEGKVTYEWDLSNANMDQALNLLMYADSNSGEAVGTITINKFYLTKNSINEENNVEKGSTSEEKVVNEITATNATVNGGWYDNGDNLYTVTKSGTDYNVAYNKKTYPYGGMYAAVKGEAMKNYKTLRVTVKGTEGEPFRINLWTDNTDETQRANHESSTYVLTGGEDEIVLDLTKFDFAGVDWTLEHKVIIMANFNTDKVTGSFTVKNATFSNEEAPAPEEHYNNEITATNKSVKGWYDSGDAKYTFTENQDGSVDVVRKPDGGWSSFKANVSGEALSSMKTFRITVSGVQGKKILVKPFDNAGAQVEKQNISDDEITIICDLSKVTDYTTNPFIMIFYQWEVNEESSLKIKSAEFSTEATAPAEEKAVHTITATEATVNNGWYENGAGVYTINKNGTDYNVTYNKGNGTEWESIYALVTGDAIKTYKTLRVTIKGTAGEIFKTNLWTGANHESDAFTLTGGDDVIILDLTKFADLATVDFTAQHRVIIMAQPGATNVNGEFIVKNATFSTEEAPAPAEVKVVNTITATEATLNGGWYDNGNVPVVYAIEKSGTNYNVTYTKGNGTNWASMYALVTGDAIKTYKTLRVTINGTAGEVFKTNIYLGGNHESDAFTLTGEDDVIVLDLTKFVDLATADYSGQIKVIIMAQPNVTGVNGTFTIKNAEFSNEAAAQKPVDVITGAQLSVSKWHDGGEAKFTVTAGENGAVNVSKVGGGSWAQLHATVKGDALKNMKTFAVTVSGIEGDQIIVNAFGIQNTTYNTAATVDKATIKIDISSKTAELEDNKEYTIMVFFNWDSTEATSFTIESARFYAEAINEITTTNTSVTGWYDGGEGKYTVAAGENGAVTVTKVGGGSWAQLKVAVTGAALKDMATFNLSLKGLTGDVIIVNAFGVQSKIETPSEADTATLSADISSVTFDETAIYEIMVFFNWDAAEETSFEIVNAGFTAAETTAD